VQARGAVAGGASPEVIHHGGLIEPMASLRHLVKAPAQYTSILACTVPVGNYPKPP
jgi:hypothetical protein